MKLRALYLFTASIALLLAATIAWPQSSTIDEGLSSGSIKVVTVEWVSAADGSVSNADISGWGLLTKATFNPHGAPTTLYDITLKDKDGVDVLAGSGANLSATVAASVAVTTTNAAGDFLATPIAGPLTMAVTNAGDTTSASLTLYIRIK